MDRVELTDKQREYWRESDHRWNLKVGATRSGKTFVDYFMIPRRIIERRGEGGLTVILGNTRETIRRNIIIPMQEIYGAKRVGNIRSDNSCYMFGERVFCLGADNVNHVDRIRGSSIKYCYGDEVATWHPEVFDMLKSRLDRKCSCFDGALNPQSPNHWLKEFLESDADIYEQHYTIFDNPFLPPDFVTNLCKEYEGTVYYQRYILGEWALAEGLIYPMYEEALTESVPAWEEDERRVYCLSLDYGTMNAFAALLWELHGGVWYAARGYYYSGRETGLQKTDEEYAQALDALLTDVHEYYQKSAGLYGQQKLETIIDPSAASFIALLNRRGKYKVRKADNDVLDGIRETATAMRAGNIKISDRIREWKDEAGGYVWDDSGDVEHPVKVNDHYMDATRYFVKTKRIATPRKTYDSVFL
jgi:PBSX family phage terminase large subunit